MSEKLMAEVAGKVRSGSVREAADAVAAWIAEHPGDEVAQMLYGTCAQLMGDTDTFLRIHGELAPRMASAPADPESPRATLWEKYRALASKLALPCAAVAASVILCGCYGCPPMDPAYRAERDARPVPVAEPPVEAKRTDDAKKKADGQVKDVPAPAPVQ